MSKTLVIPRRFNGPLASGNGGYCSGAVARFLDGGAEASLRRPVPLDVVREPDGRVAGSAVLAPDGKALAVAHALLIEPCEG